MTPLAPHLSDFLRAHLPRERGASQNTIASYAHCYRLLLTFAAERRKTRPSRIAIEDLDADLISAFLDHLEADRANSAKSRNARLAAIHSLFRYIEYRAPACLEQARRIHAIPMKRSVQPLVGYLTRAEMQALLAAPDSHTVAGLRDQAMLHLAFAAGLRVSELTGLGLKQFDDAAMPSLHVIGKGRRERILPLWQETARTLRRWIAVRPSQGDPQLFLRTPYMREIMDRLSPGDPTQRIVFMKAAQVGATEAGNNWIGFAIHQAPGPMLAVQPTVELAKRNSRQRIDPLIDESPELRERVKPARSRDAGNTLLSKEFAGGILIMTGANSAVGLRSTPARYIFLDEVDAYPASADEEGDPVTLAEARSLTFAHRRKVFLVSTPTIRGLSRIEREYDASEDPRPVW